MLKAQSPRGLLRQQTAVVRLVILALVAINATPSRAQSMDYGALESLFGEPVTTSVTGSPQRASEVPGSMTIVTADEIRRSGARDIPGILRHVAGVDVLQWTNDQADVGIRGYNQAYSPRLLVLIDGRQVYTDYYGYTPWSALPVELATIRQIEVVMGPNSALFGYNAVGGVINIVTFNPLFDDVKSVSVTGGTQGLEQGSGVFTYRFGNVAGLRVSSGAYSNDDFSTPQTLIDTGSRRGNRRFAMDVDGRIRLSDKIEAGLELSDVEAREPEMSPLYSSFYLRYRASSARLHLSADTAAGILDLVAYGNWFRVTAESPALPGSSYNLVNSIYVTQLRDVFKLGADHTFRVSAEYRRNGIVTTPVGGGHVFYDVVSGGVMWQWAVAPEVTVTNAARIDHLSLGRSGVLPVGIGLTNMDWNNRKFSEPSFNSGVVWKVDDADTLRLTAARGVQVPNLLDFGGLLSPSFFGYSGGIPFLKPTISTNYELSWTRVLPSLDSQVILRAFYQTTDDIVASQGGSLPLVGLLLTPANIGNSEAYGLELSVAGHFSPDWRWRLSYTPEAIRDHFAPGFVLANTLVDDEHTNPVHVVNSNLGWSNGPWEIDGYLRYESRFSGVNGGHPVFPVGSLVRIPDYVSIDGRIAYQINDHLTLAVSGQNLLQSPQRQTSAAAVERRVLFTVSASL